MAIHKQNEGENKVVILRIRRVVNTEAKGKYQHDYHHKAANFIKLYFYNSMIYLLLEVKWYKLMMITTL